MKFRHYHKNQRSLGKEINKVIDSYWNNEISEEEMENTIKRLFDKNKILFINNGDFTTIIKQQCGKRRLKIVSKILKMD